MRWKNWLKCHKNYSLLENRHQFSLDVVENRSKMEKSRFNIKLSRVLLLLLFNLRPSGEENAPNLPNILKSKEQERNDANEETKYDYSSLYQTPYSTPMIATFVSQTDSNGKPLTTQCKTANNIDVILTKRSRRAFPSFSSRENALFVNATRFPYDFMLIGFEQWDQNRTNQVPVYATMVKGGETKMVPVESLQSNRFYRFCCIEKGMVTALPMDCVAIYLRYDTDESSAWIYKEDRVVTIFTIALYGFFSFVFGVIFSGVFTRWHPNQSQGFVA